jgi:hypothetical protein
VKKTMKITMMAFAAAALLMPAGAFAQGRHASYLHARTDLRAAQFFLRVREEPNVTRNFEKAAVELEAAIHEIDTAAVIDRKDLEDHPRIDTGLARKDRFRKIADLMRSARHDIEQEEDNPAARRWRGAAFRHIDLALDFLHRAAVDSHFDHELGF